MPRGEWIDRFPLEYAARSERNRVRRLDRAEDNCLRNARRIRNGTLPTPEQALFAETARDRAKSKKSLVELRLGRGFVWHGGPVGGRAEYLRQAFTYPGLVSSDDPALRLFVTRTRRAHALLTGDHKAEAIGTDSKILALDCAYVETSKVMRGAERVELDSVWASWAALEAAISACGVPLPNFCVAYRDARGPVWRPHLIWLLGESVCFTKKGHRRPQAAWNNALRGLTAKLLPIGADPGGITNPHRHKNPLSPLWDRMVMALEPYALDVDKRPDGPCHPALRPHLPSPQEAIDALKQAAEAKKGASAAQPGADHPDAAIAAESNAMFRHLAAYARDRVVGHRDEGNGSREEFDAEVAAEALALSGPGLKAEMDALARGRSISKWTWIHFRTKRPKAPALAPEARRERLAAGAKAAARAKRTGTRTDVIAAIQRLSPGDGFVPTQVAVAKAVGKDLRTVKRHWQASLTAVSGGDISLSIDKKDAGGAVLPLRRLAPRPFFLIPRKAGSRPGTSVGPVTAPEVPRNPPSPPSGFGFPLPRRHATSGRDGGEGFGPVGGGKTVFQAAAPWSLGASPVSGSGYGLSRHVGDTGLIEGPFPGVPPIFRKPSPILPTHPAANST